MYLGTTREMKVYLIIVRGIFRPSIEKQSVARKCQHLDNAVLIHVAEISTEFVIQQFLIDDILSRVIVPKSQRYKQACSLLVFSQKKVQKYENLRPKKSNNTEFFAFL